MQWNKIVEVGPPPFDTLVLVRGKNTYDNWEYAVAYNECYRPGMMMTQVVKTTEDIKLPVYVSVPFQITEWIELE